MFVDEPFLQGQRIQDCWFWEDKKPFGYIKFTILIYHFQTYG